MRFVTNFLPIVRLRKGAGGGGGGEDGRKEREDMHTRKTERRLLTY